VLRHIHAADFTGLVEHSAAFQLELAVAAAMPVAHIAPELEPRLEALVRRLEANAPGALEPVAAHGDFNARQLIDAAAGLVVTDFDSMWAAPAALDHATYCAHLIRGDPADLDHALNVQETLLEGYGERPEELSWYLASMVLRRAAHPFRYFEPDWPERVDAMLAAAESAA
jgi:Ser/Thr protein kinase RdoA (MazF antagonist)